MLQNLLCVLNEMLSAVIAACQANKAIVSMGNLNLSVSGGLLFTNIHHAK